MKEITILLKYKDEQELSKLLHQVHHNVRLGVKEMDNDTNTKFRVHDKNDLPVFETPSTNDSICYDNPNFDELSE